MAENKVTLFDFLKKKKQDDEKKITIFHVKIDT